jgi:hypothetical protein
MQIGPGGVDISPKEIETIFRSIVNYLGRNKNTLCLIFTLINRNVIDWENEIKVFVVDQMTKELTQQGKIRDEKDIHDIFRITLEAPRRDATLQAIIVLENIIDQYKSGNLKKEYNKLEIDKIEEILSLLQGPNTVLVDIRDMQGPSSNELVEMMKSGFLRLARDDTDIYNLANILKPRSGLGDAQRLKNWLLCLERIKEHVMKRIFSLQYGLGCDENGALDLLRQLEKDKVI